MSKLLWFASSGGLKCEGRSVDGKWQATLALSMENVILGRPLIDTTVRGGNVEAKFVISGGFEAAQKAAQEWVDSEVAAKANPANDTSALVKEQAAPVANDKPAVWDLVQADMNARDAEGRRKYGVPLQPHNGRDVLVDAYQEALDLCVYLRQAIYERDGK